MFSGHFFRKENGARVFHWQEILISLLSLSSTKPCLSFFEILIFNQDIWGNVHYVPEINLISWGTLMKALYLASKPNKKKSETQFCRQKTAEDNNAKINIFPNIFCTFLLFKAIPLLLISFSKNLLFLQVLRTSVFLNSKCLTFLYLFISLLTNIY